MDPDTFQQVTLARENFGESGRYLQEGMTVQVHYFNGEAISGEPSWGSSAACGLYMGPNQGCPSLTGQGVPDVQEDAFIC